MNDKNSSVVSFGGEYFSFIFGVEYYGVDIFKVQEICGYDLVICVLDVLDYIKGVINLCGIIVLVIDLCFKLCLENVCYDVFIVMIVFNVEDCVVGIVVDSVFDVIFLSVEQICLILEFGVVVDICFIFGIGIQDDCMLILFDIEILLDSVDMGQVIIFDDVVV